MTKPWKPVEENSQTHAGSTVVEQEDEAEAAEQRLDGAPNLFTMFVMVNHLVPHPGILSSNVGAECPSLPCIAHVCEPKVH